MTVSNTTSSVVYTGNDSTVNFDFSFPLIAETDLVVKLFVVATEVETTLADTQYNVVFTRVDGRITGGTVTYPKGVSPTPLSATHKIVLERELPYTQPDAISNQTGFNPTTLEKSLDRLAMQIQQVKNLVDRTFVLSAASDIAAVSELQTALLAAVADAQTARDEAEAAQAAAETAESNTTSALATLIADLDAVEVTVADLVANALLDSDVGTTANKLVQLDGDAKLPAVDGSQLTGLSSGFDAGWHPYDRTEEGGAEDGIIYNFAVDGTAIEIETPDFEDGYVYRLRFDSLGNSAVGTSNLTIELYQETTDAYLAAQVIAATGLGPAINGFVIIHDPRIAQTHFFVERWVASTSTLIEGSLLFIPTVKEKILKARLKATSRLFGSGSVYLERRRIYI